MAIRVLIILLSSFLGILVQGKIQDLCRKGSDAECARYGENMCCARIVYTFKEDKQDFHACASRIGIENAGGRIFDSFGFSGTWRCEGAQAGAFASAVVIASLATLF